MRRSDVPRAVSVIRELAGSCRYWSFSGRCSVRISMNSPHEIWGIISALRGTAAEVRRGSESTTFKAHCAASAAVSRRPIAAPMRSMSPPLTPGSVPSTLVAGYALRRLRDSCSNSAPAAWARFIAPGTLASTAKSPSRPFPLDHHSATGSPVALRAGSPFRVRAQSPEHRHHL